jgi:TldD protein
VIDATGASGVVRAALETAVARLSRETEAPRVFVEDRAQATVTATARGRVEGSSFRSLGVAFEGAGSLHVSDPPFPGEPLSRLLEEPELPLTAWRGLVERAADEGLWARVVGFHQKIWVGTPDGTVQDVRRSARIELASPTIPGATLDVVLGPESATPAMEVLGGRVRESARRRSEATRIEPGRDGPPLVFAPGVAGILAHELVGHALEGDVAAAGSRLSRERGRPAAAGVRILDDPSRGRAAWTIDDEGAPARPVTLLEGGHPVGRLQEGHRRRGGYLDPVLPRMGCTFFDRGSAPAPEILRATSRGIFVRRLQAGHADPMQGRATFVVTDADRIESGELTRPLLPFLIELDVFDALASIDLVGDDLEFDTCVGSCVRAGQPLAVGVGAPTLRLGVITVIL